MTKQAGFTLIELVAVLVILALLGAMAVPRFVDMQTQALEAAKNGTKNAVRSAHALYIAENRNPPNIRQLADYVVADGTVRATNTGVRVNIDGSNYTVLTYSDNTCTTATSARADKVLCVGQIQ